MVIVYQQNLYKRLGYLADKINNNTDVIDCGESSVDGN